MARLAWAPCVLVLVVGCGGNDYSPFFGNAGGTSRNAGGGNGSSGDGQPGSGGSGNSGGSSPTGASGSAMNNGGATGSGGTTGAGGMIGSSGVGGTGNAGGASGSNGGGAGSIGTPDSGTAGAGGMGGTPDAGMSGCASNDACPDTSYCRKASCENDSRGVCTPKPKSCKDDAEETPVCGCNGVTYFSSCLAEWSGENVALHGICSDTVALKCSNANPACVNFPNAFCGELATTSAGCPSGGPSVAPLGRCWVLPDKCPDYYNHFSSCSGGIKCAHTCEAVKDERPYYRAGPGCN